MQYCQKCGKEIVEDSIVCLNCGCAVAMEQSASMDQKPEKNSKKKIVLIIIAAILSVALLIAGYFLYNYIRTMQVIEDLSGQCFIYTDIKSYPSLGEISYTTKKMDFDNEGILNYYYYYSNIDAGDEFQRT